MLDEQPESITKFQPMSSCWLVWIKSTGNVYAPAVFGTEATMQAYVKNCQDIGYVCIVGEYSLTFKRQINPLNR